MRTLLVPAAGKSSRFPNMRPKWALIHPTGPLMIEMVLRSIRYQDFDRTVVAITREHCVEHDVDVVLEQAFGDDIDVHILESSTASAAETVYRTIREAAIVGDVVVKDSDCLVEASLPAHPWFVVGVVVGPDSSIARIQSKSFILHDTNAMVIDIVEKEIVSNVVCVGVYAAPARDFVSAYEEIRRSDVQTPAGELYVSHIVSYLIVRHRRVFHHIEARRYEDWGTLTDWRREAAKHRTYIVDVDGVVLHSRGRYGRRNWGNSFEPIPQNVAKLKALSDAGHELLFMTARPEKHVDRLRALLHREGIRFRAIVAGCYHGERVVVNDFAPTNPFPSCSAVSIPRNGFLDGYLNPTEDEAGEPNGEKERVG